MRVRFTTVLVVVLAFVQPAPGQPPPEPIEFALPLPQGTFKVKRERKREPLSVTEIICRVFGSYCSQALAVAACESGYYVWASNGIYKGIFQMGDWERATYGHGPGVWAQARAAYRYFAASGYDWSPWSCKP